MHRAEAPWLEKLVQNLVSVWSALDLRRRVVIVLATVAMFAAGIGLSRMASPMRGAAVQSMSMAASVTSCV